MVTDTLAFALIHYRTAGEEGGGERGRGRGEGERGRGRGEGERGRGEGGGEGMKGRDK